MLDKLRDKITRISALDYSFRLFSLNGILILFSWLYGLGVRCYSLGFRLGLIPQKKLSCKVVSVGNIVAGGAGKTPMTIYLVKLFKNMGKKVVILSRGYKGEYSTESAIVGDGKQMFLSAAQAGDEPYMMASLKLCPVVVGKDRYRAGVTAMESFQPDILILDDGFQHRKLARDLNLLLLDFSRPFGNTRLLPAGRLREPVRAGLKRSDAVLLTRTPEKTDKPAANVNVGMQAPLFPIFKTYHRPFVSRVINQAGHPSGKVPALSGLVGKKALLVSGIADNKSFFESVRQAGINIVAHLEFIDHYRYKKSDIFLINNTAQNKGADIILTTQKDWVKLSSNPGLHLDIGIIDIEIVFEKPDTFQSFVKERLSL